MFQKHLTILASVVLLNAACADAADDGPKAKTKESPGKDVFGLSKVWSLHIEMTEKEYQAMQPPGGGMGFPGFGGPMPKQPEKKDGARDSDRSVFGTEFPWAHAELTVDGKTYKNVGIRYKGNSTYMTSARNLKRPLKIELDHYDANLRFHGLKTINLHPGVFDPSKGREALAYTVFRAAGVPAPRTAFAEVTITVPGKYTRELVGLYTLTEQVDKNFLKDRFKTSKGVLMKPERLRGLDYLGEDWERYKTTYQPKHDATKEEQKRIISFIKLVNQGSDEEFNKQIASYLDIEAFLRFLAVNSLLANLDSFFTIGHNYYLYLNPQTNRLVFIPWDVDLSMGNFAFMGTPEQQMDLSLTHPYAGTNKLTERLLAMKDVADQYQRILKDLTANCFAKEQLLKDIEAIEKVTKEPLTKEAKAVAARREGGRFGPPGGMFGRTPPDLRAFVDKRLASAEAQLAGKSKGYVPAGFGFGGGPGGGGGFGMGPGGGGGFGMGNALARSLMEALDGNKDGKVTEAELEFGMRKLFKDWDKDKNGTLDEKEIADGLRQLVPAPKLNPPGFGPPKERPKGERP